MSLSERIRYRVFRQTHGLDLAGLSWKKVRYRHGQIEDPKSKVDWEIKVYHHPREPEDVVDLDKRYAFWI